MRLQQVVCLVFFEIKPRRFTKNLDSPKISQPWSIPTKIQSFESFFGIQPRNNKSENDQKRICLGFSFQPFCRIRSRVPFSFTFNDYTCPELTKFLTFRNRLVWEVVKGIFNPPGYLPHLGEFFIHTHLVGFPTW